MKKTDVEQHNEDALFNAVIVLLLLGGAILGVFL